MAIDKDSNGRLANPGRGGGSSRKTQHLNAEGVQGRTATIVPDGEPTSATCCGTRRPPGTPGVCAEMLVLRCPHPCGNAGRLTAMELQAALQLGGLNFSLATVAHIIRWGTHTTGSHV
jgi:hypothetical protein